MEKKKSWVRRHPVWTVILIIFAVPFLIGLIGGISGTETSDSGGGNSGIGGFESETGGVYGLNERFVHGDFAYTFHGIQTSSEVGNDFLGKEAAGIFLILDVTVENIGKETETFWDSAIVIVDDLERSFESDSEAWIYLDDENFVFEQMQPGLPKRGKIIFDVPESIDGRIRVSKGIFSSNYVYVSWK